MADFLGILYLVALAAWIIFAPAVGEIVHSRWPWTYKLF